MLQSGVKFMYSLNRKIDFFVNVARFDWGSKPLFGITSKPKPIETLTQVPKANVRSSYDASLCWLNLKVGYVSDNPTNFIGKGWLNTKDYSLTLWFEIMKDLSWYLSGL